MIKTFKEIELIKLTPERGDYKEGSVPYEDILDNGKRRAFYEPEAVDQHVKKNGILGFYTFACFFREDWKTVWQTAKPLTYYEFNRLAKIWLSNP